MKSNGLYNTTLHAVAEKRNKATNKVVKKNRLKSKVLTKSKLNSDRKVTVAAHSLAARLLATRQKKKGHENFKFSVR